MHYERSAGDMDEAAKLKEIKRAPPCEPWRQKYEALCRGEQKVCILLLYCIVCLLYVRMYVYELKTHCFTKSYKYNK